MGDVLAKAGKCLSDDGRFLREKVAIRGVAATAWRRAATETIEETRMLMTRFINAPEKKRVIFTLNCTDCPEYGIKGLAQTGRSRDLQ